MVFGDSDPGDLEDLCRCGWCEECVRHGIEAQMAEFDDDDPVRLCPGCGQEMYDDEPGAECDDCWNGGL
jgi:hypothetical protein